MGFGVYGAGSAGVGLMSKNSSSSNNNSVYTSLDYNYFGFGIVLDSAVAKNKVFNYRFTLGYENLIGDKMILLKKDSINVFSMNHVFGFGFLRNKYVRIWAGPMIGLGYGYSRSKISEYHVVPIIPIIYKVTTKKSYEGGYLDLGGVLGVNINSSEYLTLGLEIGLKGGVIIANSQRQEKGTFYSQTPVMSTKRPSYNKTQSGFHIDYFARVSAMCRIGDKFTETCVQTEKKDPIKRKNKKKYIVVEDDNEDTQDDPEEKTKPEKKTE
jgi:hypothetical protein